MTIHQLFPVPTPEPEQEHPSGPSERIVLDRQPMAEALDAVRTACADLGLATLLAELDGVDPRRAASVLGEVAAMSRRAVGTLQLLGAEARRRRAIG